MNDTFAQLALARLDVLDASIGVNGSFISSDCNRLHSF